MMVDGRYEKIWLKSSHITSDVKDFATQDNCLATCLNWLASWAYMSDYIDPNATYIDKKNNNNNNKRIEKSNSRFFTVSSLRHELSPTGTLKWPGCSRVQITCNASDTHHVQHIVCHVVQKDISAIKFDRV